MTAVDSFAILGQFAFSTFPISRLYMETNSVALEQFRSARDCGFFTEEARLHNYERIGDEWIDMLYLSVSRHLFIPAGEQTFRVVMPSTTRLPQSPRRYFARSS